MPGTWYGPWLLKVSHHVAGGPKRERSQAERGGQRAEDTEPSVNQHILALIFSSSLERARTHFPRKWIDPYYLTKTPSPHTSMLGPWHEFQWGETIALFILSLPFRQRQKRENPFIYWFTPQIPTIARTRLKWAAGNSIQGSDVGGREPTSWAITGCFQVPSGRKLEPRSRIGNEAQALPYRMRHLNWHRDH